jgi:DNA-binding FadR family transcriptional regulator
VILTMLQQIDRGGSETLERVRVFIAEGGYSPGDRLPPERQLIEELGVGRAALRRALDQLERSGAIWRHVGKGTFIAGGEEDVGDLARQMTPMRMMQARLCIEPALAREAAIHATAEAMARLGRVVDRSENASSWAEYEAQDDAFHRAVGEAGDNALLVALFDQLNRVRRAVTWGAVSRRTSKPPDDHSSFEEHRRIVSAIASRDADAAWMAMREHLKSVSARLFP